MGRKLPEGWEKKELWNFIIFAKWKKQDWLVSASEFKENKWFIPHILAESFDWVYKQYTKDLKWISCNTKDILIIADWSRSWLVTTWLKWFIWSTISKITVNLDKIHHKLVYNFLTLNYSNIQNNTTWWTIPHIDKKYINSSQIAFPTSPIEQQKIVDYLDKQFQFIDNMEEQIITYENKLNELEKGILKEAFSGIEKVSIEKLVNTKYWINAWREQEWNYWLVRISDLTKEGFVSKNDQVFINKTENEIKDYKLKYWDIVLCRIWVDAGKIWIFNHNDDNAIHAWYLIKLNFNENDFLNKFIWYYGKSKDYWKQAKQLMSWAAAPQFNAPAFRKILFPKTDLNTQKSIAYKLDKQFELINSTRQEINNQKQNLKELRKAMLNDIFGGFEE